MDTSWAFYSLSPRPPPFGSPRDQTKQAVTCHTPPSQRRSGRTQFCISWRLEEPEEPPRSAVAGPGHLTPADAQRLGQLASAHAHHYFFCFRWLARTQPLSAPPPLSPTSSFLTFTPFPPFRQTRRGTNHSAMFRHRHAEPVGSDQWGPSERARPNRAGEVGPSGRCLSSQHVGGGGRGPAAAEASTAPATSFLSLWGCLSCAGRVVRRAGLSPAATLGVPRRHGGAVVGLGSARRGAVAVIRSAATFSGARGWGGPGRGSSRAARGRGAGLAGRRGAGGLGRREKPPPASGPRRRAT